MERPQKDWPSTYLSARILKLNRSESIPAMPVRLVLPLGRMATEENAVPSIVTSQETYSSCRAFSIMSSHSPGSIWMSIETISFPKSLSA